MPFKSSKSSSEANLLNISKTSELGNTLSSGGGGGGGGSPPGGPTGIVATGGLISDYTDVDSPGTKYRAHFFSSSGTLNVTSIGNYGSTVEYVVIAGGGGGGGYSGSYQAGAQGSSSEFDYGGPNPISTIGGGGGGDYGSNNPTRSGGSGGGGCAQPPVSPQVGGNGTTNQGYAGGHGYYNPSPNSCWRAGGGGGAGGPGYDGGPVSHLGTESGTASMGGAGVYTKALTGSKLGFAGGGPGGGRSAREGMGYINYGPDGPYGTGAGGASVRGVDGVENTGAGGSGGSAGGAGAGGGGAGGYRSSITGESSGGGGSAESAFTGSAGLNYDIIVGAGGVGSGDGKNFPQGGGGNGAKGSVIVRYQINSGTSDIPSTSASGGYKYTWVAPGSSSVGDGSGSVTVHVFTTSGTFSTGPDFSKTVEYFVVAGGGGGGVGGAHEGSGGGGAGGVLTGTTTVSSDQSLSVTVGSGGTRALVSGTHATNGGNSTFATLTAYGGGKGCNGAPMSPTANDPAFSGGSGGGRGYSGQPTIGYGLNPGTPAPVIASDFPGESHPYGSAQGYNGGAFTGAPAYQGGGGGGAGGAGQDGGNSGGTDGAGGIGVRAPVTFQNPAQPAFGKGYDGPDGSGGVQSGYWFAGGGGGGAYDVPADYTAKGGGAGNNQFPFAGGGSGGSNTGSGISYLVAGLSEGAMFSGGGGGGAASSVDSGSGGPGIVMIAYMN